MRECSFRKRQYLNNGWQFSHVWEDGMKLPEYEEQGMESVRLPHTNVLLPYNYCDENSYQEVCGYRYHLFASPEWEGQAVTITFEGAAHQASLYVNGELVTEHFCGYTAFGGDISSYLHFGEDNVIAVRLDSRETLNVPPFGKVIDYMTYGGIYREVYLEVHNRTEMQNLYVMPGKVTTAKPVLYFQMDVANWEAVSEKNVSVQLEIAPSDTAFMNQKEETKVPVLVTPHFQIHQQHAKIRIPVKDVVLWDCENPNLFDLTASLLVDGEVQDQQIVRIGFREASFSSEGFWLNGSKCKLRGLDRHQCYPYVGYAMPASMQQMDADVLKYELGLNAVRTSHYPQSHHFFDRCDEIGLLAFTEMPGWQHIGDEAWKEQAVKNTIDMVTEFRNHPSIFLWGVRINESADDDEFYKKTNKAAHELDPFRPTGGVRNFAKSHLFEDVYTYNDFVHTGDNQGVEPKSKITSDIRKGYLVSEYNGHMYPTKAFDCEEHRVNHALRHAKVLEDVAKYDDIAGSFGWCMADYNTHKDFGSGDRICYHGVLDMFRNHKLAAAVYASQKPSEDAVLEVGSSMDIGEHPGGFLGPVDVFTNAEKVVLYKNDEKIGEFSTKESPYKHLAHGPIVIKDFIGNQLVEKEGFSPKKAEEVKKLLMDISEHGMANMPLGTKMQAAKLMLLRGMSYQEGVDLFGKYIGNWGGYVTDYRFDAVVDGKVVKSVVRGPVNGIHLETECYHTELTEGDTYDVSAIRFTARDQHGNILPYYQEPVQIKVEGPGELIGPDVFALKGGMGGTYIKTTGESGEITVTISGAQLAPAVIKLSVTGK